MPSSRRAAPRRSRRRRGLKVTLLALGLIPLALVILLSIGPRLPANAIGQAVADKLSKPGHRKVALQGPATLELSWHPWVELREVSADNLTGGVTNRLLTADALEVRIHLLPLTRRQIQIDAMKLTGVDWFRRPRPKRPQTTAPKAAPPPAPNPARSDAKKDADRQGKTYELGIESLTLEDVTLHWLDDQGRDTRVLTLLDAQASGPIGMPVEFKLEGNWQGQGFRLAGGGGPLTTLLSKTVDWSFKVDGTADNTIAAAEGTLGRTPGAPSLDLSFSVQSPSLKDAATVAGYDLPALGPCDVDGRLTRQDGLTSIRDLAGTLGQGSVRVGFDTGSQPDGQRILRFTGDLERTDLRDLTTLFEYPLAGVTGLLGRTSVRYERVTPAPPHGDQKKTSLSVQAEMASLAYGEGLTRQLMLDTLAFDDAEGGLQVQASGRWLGKVFSADMSSERMAAWKGTNAIPLRAELETGPARATLDGTVRRTEQGYQGAFELAAAGPELSDLSKWVGIGEGAPFPYDLSAQLRFDPDRTACEELLVRLGQSDLSGSLAWNRREGTPLIEAALTSGHLDLDEISRIAPVRESKGKTAKLDAPAEAQVRRLDIPILPERLPIPDVDAQLEIEVVSLAPHTVSNLWMDADWAHGSSAGQ